MAVKVQVRSCNLVNSDALQRAPRSAQLCSSAISFSAISTGKRWHLSHSDVCSSLSLQTLHWEAQYTVDKNGSSWFLFHNISRILCTSSSDCQRVPQWLSDSPLGCIYCSSCSLYFRYTIIVSPTAPSIALFSNVWPYMEALQMRTLSNVPRLFLKGTTEPQS